MVTGWMRVLTVTLACFLGWIGGCLYEGTEKRLQNRMEDGWISLSYAAADAMGAHAGFVRTLFAAISSQLDRLFGQRLLSLPAAATSFLLSMSSYGLGQLQSHIRVTAGRIGPWSSPAFLLSHRLGLTLNAFEWLAPLLLLFARRFFASRRPWYWLVGGLSVVDVCFLPGGLWLLRGLPASWLAAAAEWFAVSIGILCDFAVLVAIRAVMRRASTIDSTLVGLAAASTIAVLVFAIGIAPYFADAPHLRLTEPATWVLATETRRTRFLAFSISLAATTNYYTVGAGLVVALGAAGLALHRMLWPVLERPLYVLQRHRFLQQKKLIGGLALGMAFVSVPSRWLELLRELVINL